jgi:hypothetical protein
VLAVAKRSQSRIRPWDAAQIASRLSHFSWRPAQRVVHINRIGCRATSLRQRDNQCRVARHSLAGCCPIKVSRTGPALPGQTRDRPPITNQRIDLGDSPAAGLHVGNQQMQDSTEASIDFIRRMQRDDRDCLDESACNQLLTDFRGQKMREPHDASEKMYHAITGIFFALVDMLVYDFEHFTIKFCTHLFVLFFMIIHGANVFES